MHRYKFYFILKLFKIQKALFSLGDFRESREGERERERHLMKSGENIVKVDHSQHRDPARNSPTK